MSNICVYCGSSSGNDPVFRQAATDLGVAIAAGGHRLIYGGGDVGLMGTVANAVLEAGGEVTGVITKQLFDLEVGHRGLTTLEVVDDMHTRKARMAELGDGVVVLPGGFGTFEEAFEVLTWNQLGIVHAPVVFLDVTTEGSFFDPLFEFVDRSVAAGFMKPEHGALAQRTAVPADAVQLASSVAPKYTPKWVG